MLLRTTATASGHHCVPLPRRSMSFTTLRPPTRQSSRTNFTSLLHTPYIKGVQQWLSGSEKQTWNLICCEFSAKARANSKTTPRVLRFIYLLGFDPTPSRPRIVEVHINICSGATCWRLLVPENLQYICPSDRVAFLYKPTGMQID